MPIHYALMCLFSLTVATFAEDSPYTTGNASPDGIGKFYMGREISQVMGHCGISWLERDDREAEEAPSKMINTLELKPGTTLADIGAGSGYHTFRIASRYPKSSVVAIDIQPEMIEVLEQKIDADDIDNVRAHLGSIRDLQLPPASIDYALIVDAYHEFSHPHEMKASIYHSLKPGGQVILLEYRLEDPNVPIKRLHKMSEAQARKEFQAAGFEWLRTKDFLPWQHYMVFAKPTDSITSNPK